MYRTLATLLCCSALLLGAGCSTHPTRGNWGEHATIAPGWGKIKRAAYDAAVDPKTWAPALGAAIFAVGDLDREVSEWAVDEQPLFGHDADSTSYDLRDATTIAYVLSALIAGSGSDGGDWAVNKAKGIAVGIAAIGVSEGLTYALKEATGRERPSEQNDKSLPSGHASAAATRAALTSRNLDYIEMPEWGRTTLSVGVHALAYGTAWARVEAQKHYPSDVLAGVALGNFVANFMMNAFFEPEAAMVSVVPAGDGAQLLVQMTF